MLVTGILRQRQGNTTEDDQRYAYELDATEIGASLKWTTVKITKTIGNTTGGSTNRENRDKPSFSSSLPESASPGGAAHP